MLELFLLAQSLKPDYYYLTPVKKAEVEQLIRTSVSTTSDPQISPSNISAILGLQPSCTKSPPSSSQIRCEWIEGERKITGFWSNKTEETRWKFQRWVADGRW